MTVRALLNLTRLHTANWEVFVFLLGPLLVGEDVISLTGARLALLGVLINAFIFVLNDLADLPGDRHNPARQDSPLVRGDLAPEFAVFLSCALPIAMWTLIAPAAWTTAAEVSFAALLALGTYLDVYQKTSKRLHPVMLDVLFGITMAGPIPIGVAATDVAISTHVWIITALFAVIAVSLNSIGGNLKDLEADQKVGFKTTALALGVRPSPHGPVYSSRYRQYVTTLVVIMAPLFIYAALEAPRRHDSAVTAIVVIATLSCWAGAGWMLLRLLTHRRAPSPRGREPYFVFAMLGLLIVTGAHVDLSQLALVLTGMLGWELSFRLYWSRHRGSFGVVDEPRTGDA